MLNMSLLLASVRQNNESGITMNWIFLNFAVTKKWVGLCWNDKFDSLSPEKYWGIKEQQFNAIIAARRSGSSMTYLNGWCTKWISYPGQWTKITYDYLKSIGKKLIINHSRKFIFFANRKTGSTSTAIALSSSCNRKDVVTPLGRDEKIRRELGYQGPTNFIPWWNKINYVAIEAKSKLFKKSANRALKTIGLHTHIEAHTALSKNYITKSQMESYFSFCFIRNPWDHAISKFFELKKDNRHQSLDLDTFLSNGMLERFAKNCRSIYSHQGTVLVKRLYQYENLQEAVIEIFDELNLTGDPQLPQAKANLRTDKRHYRDILDTRQKNKIEQIFCQEIEWGNYKFWPAKCLESIENADKNKMIVYQPKPTNLSSQSLQIKSCHNRPYRLFRSKSFRNERQIKL